MNRVVKPTLVMLRDGHITSLCTIQCTSGRLTFSCWLLAMTALRRHFTQWSCRFGAYGEQGLQAQSIPQLGAQSMTRTFPTSSFCSSTTDNTTLSCFTLNALKQQTGKTVMCWKISFSQKCEICLKTYKRQHSCSGSSHQRKALTGNTTAPSLLALLKLRQGH
jgi:hypothetical protein